MDTQLPTKAIILAAGRGRRLRPYTDQTPKPLLPVRGRPMLAYTLDALAKAGVTDVCLVTHYLAEKIEKYTADGSRWHMRITYQRQAAMLGTAHALQTAAGFLIEPTFVLAADYILSPHYLVDLKRFYQQTAETGMPHIAVSLKSVPPEKLRHSSSVRYGKTPHEIVEIIEKPPDPRRAPSHHAAALIYIVPAAITRYLKTLTLSVRREYELPAVLNRMIQDGYPAVGLLQPTPPEWEPPD